MKKIKLFFITYFGEILLISLVACLAGSHSFTEIGNYLLPAGIFFAAVFLFVLNLHSGKSSSRAYIHNDQEFMQKWRREKPIQEVGWVMLLASILTAITGFIFTRIAWLPIGDLFATGYFFIFK